MASDDQMCSELNIGCPEVGEEPGIQSGCGCGCKSNASPTEPPSEVAPVVAPTEPPTEPLERQEIAEMTDEGPWFTDEPIMPSVDDIFNAEAMPEEGS